MSKENDNMLPQQELDSHKFAGYSIDELKYRKAVVLLQREFVGAKAGETLRKFTDRNSPMYHGHDKKRGAAFINTANIVSKIFRGLDFMDYAMLGISVFSTGRKIVSLFRRKK